MGQTINGILDITTRHTPQVAVTTLALDGGSVEDVFTITGGPIEVLGIWVHIIEAVSAHSCTFRWQIDPTVGALSTDLCSNVDIVSAALGDIFYILGPSAVAMQKAINGTTIALSCTTRAFLPAGGIDAVLGNSTPTSGIATVYMVYRRMTLTSVVT